MSILYGEVALKILTVEFDHGKSEDHGPETLGTVTIAS